MTSSYLVNSIREFVKRYKTDENDRIIYQVFDTFGNMIASYDVNNYAVDAVADMLIITEHDEYSTQVKHISLDSITRIDMTLIPAALCTVKRVSY